jgi:hypothetical protein
MTKDELKRMFRKDGAAFAAQFVPWRLMMWTAIYVPVMVVAKAIGGRQMAKRATLALAEWAARR